MTAAPNCWDSPPESVGCSPSWLTRAPSLVAESLVGIRRPLEAWLRAGPPAPPNQVAAALARAMLPPEAPDQPPPWLRADQRLSFRRAVAAIRRHGGALLADGVGTGKTWIGLAVASAIEPARPIYVIAPAGIRSQWHEAAARIGLTIVSHSHETLSRGRPPSDRAGPVIIDESHRFRTPATRRYATLGAVVRAATRDSPQRNAGGEPAHRPGPPASPCDSRRRTGLERGVLAPAGPGKRVAPRTGGAGGDRRGPFGMASPSPRIGGPACHDSGVADVAPGMPEAPALHRPGHGGAAKVGTPARAGLESGGDGRSARPLRRAPPPRPRCGGERVQTHPGGDPPVCRRRRGPAGALAAGRGAGPARRAGPRGPRASEPARAAGGAGLLRFGSQSARTRRGAGRPQTDTRVQHRHRDRGTSPEAARKEGHRLVYWTQHRPRRLGAST